jgi:hypothetical protein
VRRGEKKEENLEVSESRRTHKVRGDFDRLLLIIGFDVDNIGCSMLGNRICEFLGFHECVPKSVRWCQIESD